MKRFPLTRARFAAFLKTRSPQSFKRGHPSRCPIAQALQDVLLREKFEIEPGVLAKAYVSVGPGFTNINGTTQNSPRWAAKFIRAYDGGWTLAEAAQRAGVKL